MFLASSLNKVHAQQVQIASFRITQTLRLSLRCANILEKGIVSLVQSVRYYIPCLHSLLQLEIVVIVVVAVMVIVIKCLLIAT